MYTQIYNSWDCDRTIITVKSVMFICLNLKENIISIIVVYKNQWGTCDITVIIVGNGHSDQSSNPG